MFESVDVFSLHALFPLVIIASLGLFIQKLPVLGKALGPSAVVFVALLLGALGGKVSSDFMNFGIVLFLFSIGVQAGPSFFSTFKSDGKGLFFISFIIVFSALLIAYILVAFFQMDMAFVLGLVNGALTSTPGLATISESLPSARALIGYSLSYPFGVLGVILFVRILPKILRQDFVELDRQFYASKKGNTPKLMAKSFVVNNPGLDQKRLDEICENSYLTLSISRLTHSGHTIVPSSDAILQMGDIIKVVASEAVLRRVEILVGPVVDDVKELDSQYDVKQFVLSNSENVNRFMFELALLARFNARVTRIQRNAIVFTPCANTKLKMGDKLTIAYDTRFFNELSELFGNRPNSLSDDFLALFSGVALGICVSAVKVKLPSNIIINFGLAGGVLFTAIVLSYLGKIGPVVWHLSSSTNKVIRELGLILFFAGVGTKAGVGLSQIDLATGIQGLGLGAIMTLLPMIICAAILLLFKNNLLKILGVITGGMTSTPALAALSSVTDSSVPALFYAAIYPFALVQLIVGLKLFILLF